MPVDEKFDWTETRLREIWDVFDTDQSGSIDAQEIHKAMETVGIHLDEAKLNEVVRFVTVEINVVCVGVWCNVHNMPCTHLRWCILLVCRHTRTAGPM